MTGPFMRRSPWLLLLCCAGLAQAAAPALVRSLAVQGKSADGKPAPAGDIVMPLVQAGDPLLSAKINDKLDEIQVLLSEARGGWRILMLIGGAGATVGGLVAWGMQHITLR